MKNTERQKFEESWKEAFDGSEMNPSDSVWSNIDLKLDNEKMKRRVVYYQRLAAASVIFALLLGVGTMRYFTPISEENELTHQTELKNNSKSDQNSTKPVIVLKDNNSDPQGNSRISRPDENDRNKESIAEAENGKSGINKAGLLPKENSSNDKIQSSFAERGKEEKADSRISDRLHNKGGNKNQIVLNSEEVENKDVSSSNDKTITSSVHELKFDNSFNRLSFYLPVRIGNKPLPKGIRTLEDEVKSLPAMPASMMNIASQKNNGEGLWLSVGAAAGSYSPGSSSSGNNPTALQSSVSSGFASYDAAKTNDNNKRSSVGSAYSFGFSIGKKIAHRWLVNAGFNYMNQMIMYTSNYSSSSSSNQSEAYVSDYASTKSASVRVTQPYKVNSSLEFITLPVQVGYLIIDKKLAWQLNTGVATDFFLRNTLRDQSGKLEKYSQGSGSDSPYRSINYAALASTELSYKIGSQYRLALVPGLRYSFRSSLKSQSATSYNPFVLDIGFRFRYIFK
jgi:hypothetical protein